MIRTFICIELPFEVKQSLEELQDTLRSLSRGVRWVRVEGIHLTLKFLGDVEKEGISAIAAQIQTACVGTAPFVLKVQGVGAFPDFKRPRVYWAGVDDSSGALLSLQKSIEEGLENLGFAREQRRFSPHLTLGRVRSSEGLNAVRQALENTALPPVQFTVNQVVVMQSQLRPSGAVYSPLQVIKLKEN